MIQVFSFSLPHKPLDCWWKILLPSESYIFIDTWQTFPSFFVASTYFSFFLSLYRWLSSSHQYKSPDKLSIHFDRYHKLKRIYWINYHWWEERKIKIIIKMNSTCSDNYSSTHQSLDTDADDQCKLISSSTLPKPFVFNLCSSTSFMSPVSSSSSSSTCRTSIAASSHVSSKFYCILVTFIVLTLGKLFTVKLFDWLIDSFVIISLQWSSPKLLLRKKNVFVSVLLGYILQTLHVYSFTLQPFTR